MSIAVSSVGFPAGPYVGQGSITLGSSTGTVPVALIVLAPPPPCINANPSSLSFTATQGQSDPAAQTVTLTNCGSATSWSGTTSESWLSIDPVNGTLNAGVTQDVNVAVSIANLNAGAYTGTITFTAGSSTGTVSVTLTVQPAAS